MPRTKFVATIEVELDDISAEKKGEIEAIICKYATKLRGKVEREGSILSTSIEAYSSVWKEDEQDKEEKPIDRLMGNVKKGKAIEIVAAIKEGLKRDGKHRDTKPGEEPCDCVVCRLERLSKENDGFSLKDFRGMVQITDAEDVRKVAELIRHIKQRDNLYFGEEHEIKLALAEEMEALAATIVGQKDIQKVKAAKLRCGNALEKVEKLAEIIKNKIKEKPDSKRLKTELEDLNEMKGRLENTMNTADMYIKSTEAQGNTNPEL